jgi:hypothetical protein
MSPGPPAAAVSCEESAVASHEIEIRIIGSRITEHRRGVNARAAASAPRVPHPSARNSGCLTPPDRGPMVGSRQDAPNRKPPGARKQRRGRRHEPATMRAEGQRPDRRPASHNQGLDAMTQSAGPFRDLSVTQNRVNRRVHRHPRHRAPRRTLSELGAGCDIRAQDDLILSAGSACAGRARPQGERPDCAVSACGTRRSRRSSTPGRAHRRHVLRASRSLGRRSGPDRGALRMASSGRPSRPRMKRSAST